MRTLSGQTNFFGLDLGATAVRVVGLKGKNKIKTLDKYGWASFAGTESVSDAEIDRDKVKATIFKLLSDSGIKTKNVAVNIPSNHVFTTVIDMDKMPLEDLAKTIKYQAETFIPTPLAEAKVDWAHIGDSPKDPNKMEVLLSSVTNKYVDARLAMFDEIGLNVIAFEPDSMAIARALVATDSAGAQMVIDIGSHSTDLVISLNNVPHLVRTFAVGAHEIVQAAIVGLKIDQTQAQQFVFKFGLGKDKLEGQVYNAIIGTVDTLMAEIDKSLKFFAERYPTSKLDRIIATGGASALPEFPLYMANKFGINVEIGNAWRNTTVPANKQNEVSAVANHFAVAVGLAERQP